jgi:hypothetical protein
MALLERSSLHDTAVCRRSHLNNCCLGVIYSVKIMPRYFLTAACNVYGSKMFHSLHEWSFRCAGDFLGSCSLSLSLSVSLSLLSSGLSCTGSNSGHAPGILGPCNCIVRIRIWQEFNLSLYIPSADPYLVSSCLSISVFLSASLSIYLSFVYHTPSVYLIHPSIHLPVYISLIYVSNLSTYLYLIYLIYLSC